MVSGTRFDAEDEFERALSVAELLLTHIAAHETVIVGDARGVDAIVRKVLEGRNPLDVHQAKWRQHGDCFCSDRSAGSTCAYAGLRRTDEMLDLRPERLVAIWDGRSPGTKHAIKGAERRGIPVERYRLPPAATLGFDMDVPSPA